MRRTTSCSSSLTSLLAGAELAPPRRGLSLMPRLSIFTWVGVVMGWGMAWAAPWFSPRRCRGCAGAAPGRWLGLGKWPADGLSSKVCVCGDGPLRHRPALELAALVSYRRQSSFLLCHQKQRAGENWPDDHQTHSAAEPLHLTLDVARESRIAPCCITVRRTRPGAPRKKPNQACRHRAHGCKLRCSATRRATRLLEAREDRSHEPPSRIIPRTSSTAHSAASTPPARRSARSLAYKVINGKVSMGEHERQAH